MTRKSNTVDALMLREHFKKFTLKGFPVECTRGLSVGKAIFLSAKQTVLRVMCNTPAIAV